MSQIKQDWKNIAVRAKHMRGNYSLANYTFIYDFKITKQKI